ncbi:MAG: elongation factor 4 [Candidatus Omnitrophica bacterium]|nr:elongation factor 4 [Candidatus Omnitrophota bacterium]
MITRIRNFSIIAHIDHGKSTLADRLLSFTGTIEDRKMREQVLDTMDLERERGITIKAQAVRMEHEGYILNLIDTPGHVDFSYEVSRSLAACEGAILLIDATQGIEAQTLANAHLALAGGLAIIPVINKIDLASADPGRVKEELKNAFGIKPEDVLLASAKTGEGVKEIIRAIIERVPPPAVTGASHLQALIFDSHYDSYRGVVARLRVFNGELAAGKDIKVMSIDKKFEVQEVGYLRMGQVPAQKLLPGEVGYMIAGIREVRDCRVGDTVTGWVNPAPKPLPGYKQMKPMVFCGFYPVSGDDYGLLKEAIGKLQLNDAALYYEPETSTALGFGFRCGFLGLLHLEIVQERLEREFELDIVATAPSVVYRVILKNGTSKMIENPSLLPPAADISAIEEPYCCLTVLSPSSYMGAVMELVKEKEGEFISTEYLDPERLMMIFELPLSRIIVDFHDRLKAVTRGYASMDYEVTEYRVSDVVKMDILLNYAPVDALSAIVSRRNVQYVGRELAAKLRTQIPRHQFEIPIQAVVGGKVVARETIAPMRKDVLQKCYGGDITRKRKLLEKQKEGKRRMKRIGSVDIPQDVFLSVLKINK